VAEAMNDLYEEGHRRPTAPQVAERAGVSVRAVFHHFSDMEQLACHVGQGQFERNIRSAQPALLTEGPLRKRLELFVQRRAQLMEPMTPVRRAALLLEPFSELVAGSIASMRSSEREEVVLAFRPELEALEADEAQRLLEALTAVSSWSHWDCLRSQGSLDVEAARQVVSSTLRALLRSAI